MLLDLFFAIGPVGGIDPNVAIFYALMWTFILGGLLYGSVIFFPSWVDLGEEAEKH